MAAAKGRPVFSLDEESEDVIGGVLFVEILRAGRKEKRMAGDGGDEGSRAFGGAGGDRRTRAGR